MTLANLGLGFLQSWINFIVVSIASAQVSVLVTYVNLPLITGYMFFGLLVGPQVCELVTNLDLDHLQYITQFALAFICLSAGAELYLPELKALFKRILILTGCLTVITFVSVLFVVYGESMAGLASYVDTLPPGLESPGACQFSIAMIAAAIMVSQSPASAIAVVRELGAKGPFTSTMLGVCVLIDVVVLLLATIATSITNSECDPNSEGFQVLDLGLTLATIILAVGVGWIVGKIIIFVIWLPRVPGSWLVPWIGFGVFQLSEWLLEETTMHWRPVNLDPLLICITAGYVVANQSRNRRKFLRFFNKAGPIIFIPFFTLTGAGLKLGVLLNSVPFAAITALTRAGAFAVSSVVGGKWSDVPAKQRNTLWMSMITQAGVSLGIAAEVAMSFPSFGPDFKSVMIAVILINQVLGPILCSKALSMNGEVGMVSADDDEDDRIKRCMLIGVNDDSLAIAQRLLNTNWDVLFIDSDKEKLALTSVLSAPVRKHSHEADHAPAEHSTTEHERASEEHGPHGSADNEHKDSVDSDLMPETSVIGSSSMIEPSSIEMSEPGSPREAPHHSHHSAYIQVETQERVQTRLVELPRFALRSPANDLLGTSDSNDLLQTGDRTARQHEAVVAAYSAVMEDLNSTNIQACAVFMQSDSQAWALCDRLLEKLHITRVVAQINNPNWATMFASIGVLSIYSFSCTVAMIFRTLVMPGNGKLEFTNPKKPLHTQLAQLIKPEASDTVPVHLLYSSEEDQRAFLADHPNPPLATEKLWKFDERFKVVSAAQREEYLNSVYRVHAARLQINTRNNFLRAAGTFSGPSMLAGADNVELSHDGSSRDNDASELSDVEEDFDLQKHEEDLANSSDSSDDDEVDYKKSQPTS